MLRAHSLNPDGDALGLVQPYEPCGTLAAFVTTAVHCTSISLHAAGLPTQLPVQQTMAMAGFKIPESSLAIASLQSAKYPQALLWHRRGL